MIRLPASRLVFYLAFCLALALSVVRAGAAAAQTDGADGLPVALELVLAVDASASVDSGEFRLQMDGIAAAFRDPEVVAAIAALGPGGVAVTLVLWSAAPRQSIDWRQVHDGASAEALAARIARAARVAPGHTTAIGSAVRYGAELIAANPYAGRRRSIDVSGDGQNNDGLPVWIERNRAVAAGITINGLAILDREPDLKEYYARNVIGGPGAFVYTAADFADFARAFRDKLLREIRPLVAEAR